MNKISRSLKSLFTLFTFIVTSSICQAQVYVDIGATGANDGTSWANAYTDLKAAIDATASGEIWVAEGTYLPDISSPGDMNLSFSMKNGVAIYGGFDGTETMLSDRDPVANVTILSGDIGATGANSDNSYHVVDNSANTLDATAVLDGFTISGGNANGASSASLGGGMYNDGSSPTLTDCTFSNNSASNGGGMLNDGSSPTLTNCTFSNNSAPSGGGMFNFNSSSPTLTDCTFSNNSASFGGGMFNINSSSPTLTNCTFSANTASSNGGGMFNFDSSPTLTNCTFSNNSASFGGGIYNQSSSPTLTNCILWGNGTSFNGTAATVTYSIIEGTSVYAGTGNSNSDPLFVDASDPDGPDDIPGTADDGISIFIGSPADGTADAASAPATDIRGATRIAPHDMGAYIAMTTAPPKTILVDIDATGANNGTTWADAYTDLNDGISAANSGDDIWVAEGTYLPDVSIPGDRDLSFSMKNGVAIYGGFDGTETVLSDRDPALNVTILSGDLVGNDVVTGSGATLSITMNGDNSYHVVDNSANSLDATAILDGFTISGGNANGNEGNGGGMLNSASSPTIINCLFTMNHADLRGGGMYNFNGGNCNLTSCTFKLNLSSNGAGIYNRQSSNPIVSNCFFVSNVTTSNAGAVYNSTNSDPFFNNCVFHMNSSVKGGAILNNVSSNPTFRSCTFTSNMASNDGGAMFNLDSNPIVANCIAWGNSNSFNNAAAAVSYSIIEGTPLYSGSGNSNNDPLFENASDPDGDDDILGTPDDGLRIQTSSPGAGTALASISPTSDITGAARTAPHDMGAYIASVLPQAFMVGTETFATLQAAIDELAGQPGEIELLTDFTEGTVTMIPNYATLIVPTVLTLTFTNDLGNAGTIANNGTITVGTLTNTGTYKGSGTLQGDLLNNGTLQVGGN